MAVIYQMTLISKLMQGVQNIGVSGVSGIQAVQDEAVVFSHWWTAKHHAATLSIPLPDKTKGEDMT